MSRIEDLKAQLAAAKAAADAVALTKAEIEEAELLAQISAASEEAAAAEATRRANGLAERVAQAKAKAPPGVMVAGVDLVALFPLGSAPPEGQLPGKGGIVIRNPPPASVDKLNREVEAKSRGLVSILVDLLCECTVDPDPTSTDGITLRAFCDAYPDAATQAAQRARELGGAKAAADKRGR